MTKKVKTNALRQLDKAKVTYEIYTYDVSDGQIDGIAVAGKTGQPADHVYKTLVTKQDDLYVFVIPVTTELDLKKAAKAAGVKKLELLPVKELLPKTSYIRGGCSPVGMKKSYPTYIDARAVQLDYIVVSAGQQGIQMKLQPEQLAEVTRASFQDVIKDED